MIRNLLAGLALFTAVTLQAGTIQIPKEEPIGSFTFPESWKVEADDTEIIALSADEEIYVNIATHDGADLAAAVADAVKTLAEEKITIDQNSAKKAEGDLNGLKMVNIDFDGKNEDEAAKISITVFQGKDEKRTLLMIYVASPEAEKKHAKDLQALQQGIKAAK